MSDRDLAGLSPGDHLRAEFDRIGLDQVAVAQAIGVSRQAINNIVNGRQPISRAMAAKLGRLTERSSDYWLQSYFPSEGERHRDQSGDTPSGQISADHRAVFRPAAVLVNHQIIRAVRDGLLIIEPFTAANVQLASIDLTLDDFIITTDGQNIDVSDGQGFSLRAGESVIVRTRESIEFPIDYVGRIGAMARLAKFGIIISHGFQVDPGFRGQLQFCLFNAGGRTFEITSGASIISLEIIPLAATPTIDAGVSAQIRAFGDHAAVISHFRSNAGEKLVRDFLRSFVRLDAARGAIKATIPELDVAIVEAKEDAAIAGAVRGALETLGVVRANPQIPTELGAKYRSFFDGAADDLQLSEMQVRDAVAAMSIAGRASRYPIVKLRNGADTILQPPVGSAKITLKDFARQLHEEPDDLILILCGIKSYWKAPGDEGAA